MDIKYICIDFIKCHGNFNKFIVNRIKGLDYGGYVSIPKNAVKGVLTQDNVIYEDPVNYEVLKEVDTEYCYDDLQQTDLVLDIGANIGAFSLKVKDRCAKIFAVEPVFVSELQKNVKLNKADDKITVLPYALGCDKSSKSFSELRKLCGGRIDFLKIDCEGGEWCISQDELRDIRRIEAEVHAFNGERLEDFLKLLDGYELKTEYRDDGINVTMLVHAFKINRGE